MASIGEKYYENMYPLKVIYDIKVKGLYRRSKSFTPTPLLYIPTTLFDIFYSLQPFFFGRLWLCNSIVTVANE